MVSEETREKDERLREELRHVDLEKLKTVIKPLLAPAKKQKSAGSSIASRPHKLVGYIQPEQAGTIELQVRIPTDPPDPVPEPDAEPVPEPDGELPAVGPALP